VAEAGVALELGVQHPGEELGDAQPRPPDPLLLLVQPPLRHARHRTGERAGFDPPELPLDADGQGGDVVLAVAADRVQHAVEDGVGRQVRSPVSVRPSAAVPSSMSWPVQRRSMSPSV
jgi:hypothetical protein